MPSVKFRPQPVLANLPGCCGEGCRPVQPITRPKGTLRQPVHADRVMVVDEHPHGRGADATGSGLIRLLTERGCRTTLARDGEAAVDAAAREGFLFVLLRAPRPAALAILGNLRERAPTARAVIVTADPSLESAVEAWRVGAYDYLWEPVDPSAVEALIRRARQECELRQRALLHSLQAVTPGLVHELRNPLSGILAGSQMLASLVGMDQRAQEYVQILREEAQQLQGFLSRLAEFGRLPAGRLAAPGGIDLHGLLGRILNELRPACAARRIQQVSRFDSRVSQVQADATRLGQACAEIAGNALEAMPGGGTLTVTTRLVPEVGDPGPGDGDSEAGLNTERMQAQSAIRNLQSEIPGWVEIAFADTGAGMTDEVRRRAFEPFFSTRPRALGVGLPLAQAILLAHGGIIRLESRARAGTRILLSLPLASTQDGQRLPASRGPDEPRPAEGPPGA